MKKSVKIVRTTKQNFSFLYIHISYCWLYLHFFRDFELIWEPVAPKKNRMRSMFWLVW
jgi:hypothetical protein